MCLLLCETSALEKSKSEGQKRLAILRFLDEHDSIFRRQGTVRETWRTYRGRKVGPFYELRYRDGPRLRSVVSFDSWRGSD